MANSDELGRWLAEVRVDEAAASRARERWLRQQAGEEATLVGVLLDLAERGTTVLVQIAGGRLHRQTVTAVAEDFCALGTGVLVAYSAISGVQPLDEVAPTGDRPRALDLTLREALVAMCADRPRILVVGRDGTSRAGELISVGQDLIVVRPEGEPRQVYVPVGWIAEVAITG